jgi:ABC-type oligopeptide transport system ATPase subunit
MSLIIADDLTKTYTKGPVSVEALKNVTFALDRASFVSFVGPSGSGKTTTGSIRRLARSAADCRGRRPLDRLARRRCTPGKGCRRSTTSPS